MSLFQLPIRELEERRRRYFSSSSAVTLVLPDLPGGAVGALTFAIVGVGEVVPAGRLGDCTQLVFAKEKFKLKPKEKERGTRRRRTCEGGGRRETHEHGLVS
jgi:hypothetical protein